MTSRIALIGGIYSNYHALVATLADIRARGVDETFFLGDLGAFGPHPDRIPETLIAHGIPGIQGNYEESLSTDAQDCNCGYTDPQDNHFAQISYDYTAEKTSPAFKRWMGELPREIRFRTGSFDVLLCHGSPRKINEFLWRSTTPNSFLSRVADDARADVIVCTHTGLHWHREFAPGKHLVNAGVIGRPANDGLRQVWYTILEIENDRLAAEFIPVSYDWELLAREMREEKIPQEFIETVATGWWTTCLEALPAKERARGRY